MRDYGDDCIHLKACRRICKYHKIQNRNCDKENCSAYQSENDLIEEINAIFERYKPEDYSLKDSGGYDFYIYDYWITLQGEILNLLNERKK